MLTWISKEMIEKHHLIMHLNIIIIQLFNILFRKVQKSKQKMKEVVFFNCIFCIDICKFHAQLSGVSLSFPLISMLTFCFPMIYFLLSICTFRNKILNNWKKAFFTFIMKWCFFTYGYYDFLFQL